MFIATTRFSCVLVIAALLAASWTTHAQDMGNPQFIQMVRHGCESGVPPNVRQQLSSARISSYCDCYSRTITAIMTQEELQEALKKGTRGLTEHPKVLQAAQGCAASTLR